MTAAGNDVLMIQRQTGQPGLPGGARHEEFQVRHAYVGLELLDNAQHRARMMAGAQQQWDSPSDGGRHIDLVVLEDGPQIGNPPDGELAFQHAGSVIRRDEQKIMGTEAAGNGQRAHGMAMSRSVHPVKNACHKANLPRQKHSPLHGFVHDSSRRGKASTRDSCSPASNLAKFK